MQNAIFCVNFAVKYNTMPSAVRISDDLINLARKVSKAENRSLTGQIEYWAKIGKLAEENPDLPYHLLREILLGLDELRLGKSSEYLLNEP